MPEVYRITPKVAGFSDAPQLPGTSGGIVDGGAGYDGLSVDLSTQTMGLVFDFRTGATTLADGATITGIEWVSYLTLGSGNDTVYLTPATQVQDVYGGGGSDKVVLDYSAFNSAVTFYNDSYYSGGFRSYVGSSSAPTYSV